MDIGEWIRSFPGATAILVTVEEITGSIPVMQYKVNVTGTYKETPISLFYVTTKPESINDLADSTARYTRYTDLAAQAELEAGVETQVVDQIEAFDPTPPDPDPEP